MSRPNPRWIPLAMALALPGLARGAAVAQVAVEVSSMSVDIWPEYDEPAVLAIYQGRLGPSVDTPTDFSFVIPEGARIHMVGGVAADGRHVHAEFETRARDDGLTEVSYELTVPNFYMEFYYDPLGTGEERSFSYPVVSPYDVASVAVRVQQPRGAEGFSVSPFTSEMAQDDKGFVYQVVRMDSLPAESLRSVAVRYRKVEREPSVEPPEQGSQAAGVMDALKGRRVMGLLAVLFAGAAIYGFFVGSRQPRSETVLAEPRDPTRPREQRFCMYCGSAVAPSHRYCGECGTPTEAAMSSA